MLGLPDLMTTQTRTLAGLGSPPPSLIWSLKGSAALATAGCDLLSFNREGYRVRKTGEPLFWLAGEEHELCTAGLP